MQRRILTIFLCALIIGCITAIPGSGWEVSLVEDWQYVSPTTFVMDVSPDGEYVVIGAANNLLLFHESSNVPLWTTDTFDPIVDVSLAENGDYIAITTNLDESRVYDRHGNKVGTGFPEAERTAISWNGHEYAFVGARPTDDFVQSARLGSGQLWFHNCGIINNVEIEISGNGHVVAAYHNTESWVKLLWGSDYGHGAYPGAAQNSAIYTFTDPSGGNIVDVEIDYSGSTIVAASDSGEFGVISNAGWAWSQWAGGPILDVALSADGGVVAALDNLGNIYCVRRNGSMVSYIPPAEQYKTIQISGNGQSIVCSTSTGNNLALFDTNLNQRFYIWNFSFAAGEDNMGISFDGHHIWGRKSNTLYHFEAYPVIDIGFTPNYFANGYDHVNETTQFDIYGDAFTDVYNFHIDIDGRGWSGYSGPFNLSGLTPGLHRINYYGMDSNGYIAGPDYIDVWLDLYGYFNSTEVQLNLLQTEVSNIWATINVINNDILNLNSTVLAGKINNLTANLSMLQQNVSSHWNTTDNLTQAINTLQENVSNIWENITVNQESITLMLQRITNLEANGSLMAQDISTLYTNLNLLNNTLLAIEADMGALAERADLLEVNGTAINLTVAQTIMDISNITTSLVSHYAEANAIVAQINDDLDAIESRVSTNVNSISTAMTIAIVGMILGIIGLLLGLMSLLRKKGGEDSEPE